MPHWPKRMLWLTGPARCRPASCFLVTPRKPETTSCSAYKQLCMASMELVACAVNSMTDVLGAHTRPEACLHPADGQRCSTMHEQPKPAAASCTPLCLAAAARLSDAAVSGSSAWLHERKVSPLPLPHPSSRRQSYGACSRSVDPDAGNAQVCLAAVLGGARVWCSQVVRHSSEIVLPCALRTPSMRLRNCGRAWMPSSSLLPQHPPDPCRTGTSGRAVSMVATRSALQLFARGAPEHKPMRQWGRRWPW